jgi:hypothetical protein
MFSTPIFVPHRNDDQKKRQESPHIDPRISFVLTGIKNEEPAFQSKQEEGRSKERKKSVGCFPPEFEKEDSAAQGSHHYRTIDELI